MLRWLRWILFVGCLTVSTAACGRYWWSNDPVYAAQRSSISSSFDRALSPHGEWVFISQMGWTWRPFPHLVGSHFYPYGTHGRWVATNHGWMFVSDFDWGWATFHYGRWFHDPYYGWVWLPGYQWAPAWVAWRWGAGFVGWVPLGPSTVVAQYYPPYYCYVPAQYFGHPDFYRYRVHDPFHRDWVYARTQPTPRAPAPELIATAGGARARPVRVLPPRQGEPGPTMTGDRNSGPIRPIDGSLRPSASGTAQAGPDGVWAAPDERGTEQREPVRRGPAEGWSTSERADDVTPAIPAGPGDESGRVREGPSEGWSTSEPSSDGEDRWASPEEDAVDAWTTPETRDATPPEPSSGWSVSAEPGDGAPPPETEGADAAANRSADEADPVRPGPSSPWGESTEPSPPPATASPPAAQSEPPAAPAAQTPPPVVATPPPPPEPAAPASPPPQESGQGGSPQFSPAPPPPAASPAPIKQGGGWNK